MEWKTIETAPKNGQEILVIYMRQMGVMKLVNWNKIHKYWESKGEPSLGLENNATHWMPLPPAPNNSSKTK